MALGCCCGGSKKEHAGWNRDFMKQFKVTRNSVTYKTISFQERVMLCHKCGVQAFKAVGEVIQMAKKLRGWTKKTGISIPAVDIPLDVIDKVAGVAMKVIGLFAWFLTFNIGMLTYTWKTVSVSVKIPLPPPRVIFAVEAWTDEMQKDGECTQLFDTIIEQTLAVENLVPSAPWLAHFKLMTTAGKRIKLCSLWGRSVMCLLDVYVAADTASPADLTIMQVDCTFADDLCCCCGMIFPAKDKLFAFGQRVLLELLKMDREVMAGPCNELSKSLSLAESEDAVKRAKVQYRILPKNAMEMVNEVRDMAGGGGEDQETGDAKV